MAETGRSKMKKVLRALQREVVRKGDPSLSYDLIERTFKRDTEMQDRDKIFAMVQDMIHWGYLIPMGSGADPVGALVQYRTFQIGEEGLILISENQERIA